ncbi:MAG: hypothetical protein R2754_05520 [Microthrixaceae bacterium]
MPPEATELPGVEAAEAVDVPDPADTLAQLGIRVTTMGRGPDADPLFFASAAAAGALGAQLVV